jgi:hypothetical protein
MGVSRRHNWAGISGLVVFAALLSFMIAALAFGFIPLAAIEALRQAPPDTVDQDGRYSGVIVIPSGIVGQCRHIEFNNNTGAFRETGSGECRDEPTQAPNSTEGRMNAIRDAFSKK